MKNFHAFLILIVFLVVVVQIVGRQETQGLANGGHLKATSVSRQGSSVENGPNIGSQAAGQAHENSKDGLKYVWIPSGRFLMGCSPGDQECLDDEKPPHHVTVSKGFWMGKTEVTVLAYKRFSQETTRQMPSAPPFNSEWVNDAMPITNVTWDEARDYCTWAGGRLPTEAEWEYAARGGSPGPRYGPLDEIAWYDANSGMQTHPVAQKLANKFGLYDMLGNVLEWVNDWYDKPYAPDYYQHGPSQDPKGPARGMAHVIRGGSWNIFSANVRASYRGNNRPSTRSYNYGFRCAR